MSRLKSSEPSPETELGVDHLVKDVGRRSRRGGAILLSAQGIRVLGQMGTLVVLVRLLPPSAFGLLAMVAAIGVILDLVKEFGLSSATIQKQEITQAQVSALFWINAGVGAVLGAGLFLAAPLLAHFYGQPELTGSPPSPGWRPRRTWRVSPPASGSRCRGRDTGHWSCNGCARR
jgi:O-antigen/teichoic acid export membrane protein